MIPIRLAVRNFMPYRDNVPPLDLTGIHTASISGENGNGIINMACDINVGTARTDDDIIGPSQAVHAIHPIFIQINEGQFSSRTVAAEDRNSIFNSSGNINVGPVGIKINRASVPTARFFVAWVRLRASVLR